MKIFSLLSVFFLFDLLNSSFTYASEDLYEVINHDQDLKVSWPSGSLIVDGVLGNQGQVTRDLIDFNGGKALHYENPTTKSHFEAYLTISRVDANVVIDCIYGDIRNGANGLLINKAVCGLNERLQPGYEVLISKYSSAWKDLASLVVLTPWMEDPTPPSKIEEARVKDLTVARIYNSLDDLTWHLPVTVVERGDREHSFDGNTVFTVFNARDLNSLDHIEVVGAGLAAPFKKLTYEKLKTLID